jgi:hypothetical protein
MVQKSASYRKRLKQGLEAFGRSVRFSLFKDVCVSRLMPDGFDPLGAFAELTFEQLLNQFRIHGDSVLAITPEQEEGLFHLLQVLGEDGATSAHLQPDDDISVAIPDSFSSIDVPTLDQDLKNSPATSESEDPPNDVPVGSVSLELALRAILSKIVTHERYDTIRKRLVGEFWDPNWPAAPFEEAMSIEQLAGLDLAVLFKKRMVTDNRVQSIIRALKRSLSTLDSDKSDSAVKERGSSPKPITARASDVDLTQSHTASTYLTYRTEMRVTDKLPSSVAAVAVWETLLGLSNTESVVAALVDRVSPCECAAIVLGDAISPSAEEQLKHAVDGLIDRQKRELVQALLNAPAVRLDLIARVLCGLSAQPTAGALTLAAVVARGLGAVPLLVHGKPCDGYWTVQPDIFTAFMQQRKFKQRRKKASPDAGALLSSYLNSGLDPFLQRVLTSAFKTHGAGKKSRKGPPNQLRKRRRKGR